MSPTPSPPNGAPGLGADEAKTCSRCQATKTVADFYTYRGRDGTRRHMAKCKVCHSAVALYWARRNPLRAASTDAKYKSSVRGKRRRRMRAYGLTDNELMALEVGQGGDCPICGQHKGDALVVDHDHATGRVRSLLCGPCNVGLGAFADDPMRLVRAARYLVKHRQWAQEDAAEASA